MYNSYHKDWLYEENLKAFKESTGAELTDEECEFLKNFFDTHRENGSKEIYYEAVFDLKRGRPKWFVHYKIAKEFKKRFQKANMSSLVKAHKIFSKKMLFSAIKAYCKIPDE